MKKACFLLLVLFLSASSFIFAEDREIGKGFNFGIGAGGFPLSSGQHGFFFSLDIGYGFTERLALRADISYSQSTNSILSEVTQGQSYSGEFDNSVKPFCLSFLYFTSVNNILSAEIGLGAGYYGITLKEDMTSSNPFSGTIRRTNTYKLNAIAPHFLVGMETS